MHPKRKFPNSQLLTVKEINGVRVTLYIVEDLNDDELQQHFNYYLAKEDYDYLAELAAEATRRGIKLTLEKV